MTRPRPKPSKRARYNAAINDPQVLEKALGSQLKVALPKALSDAFSTTVVPSFERASQVMFGQIEAAFSSGLSSHLEAARLSSDATHAALSEATSLVREAAKQLTASAAASAGGGGAAAGAGGGRGISVAELEARRDPRHVISSEW